jgi:hypothetical protein
VRHPAANDWPLIAGLQGWESRLAGNLAGRGRFGVALYEFFRFGVKQAWACLFGGLMCCWAPTGGIRRTPSWPATIS